MTTLLRLSLVAATLLGTLLAAPHTLAASGDKVLADWRADGSIDGDYSLQELQAADRQINEQEREYTFWNDAYAEALRRLRNPDAPQPKRPPTVPPQDFDKDGDIDAKDVATAKQKTQELREEQAERSDDVVRVDEVVEDEEDEEGAAGAASKGDDDGGGLGWLAALLFIVPASIIGFGAWRMQRTRGGAASKPALDADAPTSSFAAGDDLA